MYISSWNGSKMKAGNIKYGISVCQSFVVTETFTYVYMLNSNIKDIPVMICSQGALQIVFIWIIT